MFYVFIYFCVAILGVLSAKTTVVLKGSACTSIPKEGNKRRINLFLILSFVIFSLLSALRGETVGIDTKSYTAIYDRFAAGWSLEDVQGFATTIEKGYLLFAQIVVSLFKTRFAFFLCNGLIIYGCYLVYIKKYSTDLILSVLIFTALYFTSTFNIVRQYAAIGIMLIALDKIKQRKFFMTIILSALAVSFHQSSLLLVPVLILALLPRKSKNILWYELGILVILAIIRIPAIFEFLVRIFNYERLLNGVHFQAADSNGVMGLIYLVVVIVGTFIAVNKRQKADEEFAFNLICASVGTAFTVLAAGNEMFARAGAGYIFFIIILLPMIIDKLFIDLRTKQFVRLAVVGTLALAALVTGNSYPYVLYRD